LRADSPENARVYIERDMREIELFPFGAGQVAVFSMSSPATTGTNEDAAALIPFGAAGGVLVVADGAGGLRGGAKASSATVNELRTALERAADARSNPREAILEGIETAGRKVMDLNIGAATTVAVVELNGERMRPYHVGDSQILVRGRLGDLKLLTVAHSPVGYAVQMGLLDEEEALRHEDRHLLFNVVGLQDMTIEMGMEVELEQGDTVLVACDGLFDNLKVAEIADLLARPLGDASKALIEHCLERMGTPATERPSKPDDLTVIVYRVGTDESDDPQRP